MSERRYDVPEAAEELVLILVLTTRKDQNERNYSDQGTVGLLLLG